MEAKAIAKYVHISPLKAQFICNEIRGLQVDEALAKLEFTTKRGARELYKVLKPAVANAENNLSLDRADLYVKEAYVGDGPTVKCSHPKAKRVAYPILERSSHIGIVVAERE